MVSVIAVFGCFCVSVTNLPVRHCDNWTENAERYNFENALFLDEPGVIKAYQEEFKNMWAVAKTTQ